LSRTLEAVVDSLAARAEEKGLDVILRYAPGTPNFVIGDTARVRQVLLNFMSNAIKFTEKGHVMLNAEARILGNTETIIRFEVRDSGIGISKDAQKKIFEKFIQADASTTKRYGGTGLGLAISQQLAQLMGGEVGVTSEPGKGSTFWFEVPFRLDQAQPQNYNLPKIDLSQVHLLVVDDHELNRRILLELAHGWNVKAAAAESGEEALRMMKLAKAQGNPFQIAILDYQLPNMDGEDLSNLIKTDTDLADTSLILLTSMGMRGDAGKFQEIGFEAYLVKPARASVLLDTVTTVWMNRIHGRQEGGIITQHTFAKVDNRRDEFGDAAARQAAPIDPLAALHPQSAPPAPPQPVAPQPTFVPQPPAPAQPAPAPAFVPQPQPVAAPEPAVQEVQPAILEEPAPPPAPEPAPEPVRTSFTKYVPSQPLDVTIPADEAIFAPAPTFQEPTPQEPAVTPQEEQKPVTYKPSVPLSGGDYPKRILLVEDQLTNRLVVETILDNMQLGSIHAENGVEAVQKAAMQDFELILMDVQMPIMNGFDAAREIRKIEERESKKRAIIIAVTANAMAGDRERCMEAGMDDYISKPIQVIELQNMIRKYLGISE
ncbi:MAG: response regulator, partial [Alphaproteobacteria bacterium]|nr:response regulator [Alphaproteobacteria bacterium]